MTVSRGQRYDIEQISEYAIVHILREDKLILLLKNKLIALSNNRIRPYHGYIKTQTFSFLKNS